MWKSAAQQIRKKVVDDYNSISGHFDQTRQHNWDEFQLFLKYIKNSDKIADIGCGNGRFYKFLKKHKKSHYIGIDNSKQLLEKAKKELKTNFKLGDFLDIPLEKNSIDTAVAIASFHHIPSKKLRSKALRQIRYILKQNGTFILTVWNLFQPKYQKYINKARLRNLYTFGKYDPRDTFIPWAKTGVNRYYYAFKQKELKKLLTKHGFKVLEEHRGHNFTFICQKVCKKQVNIMKVDFDKTTLEKAAETAIQWTKEEKQRIITTPNPEILLEAQKNAKFLKILQNSHLKIPDGIGILWAAKYQKITQKTSSKIIKITKWLYSLAAILFYPKYLRTELKNRVTGTDLLDKISEKAEKSGTKIFLLGASPGIAEQAKKKLTQKHQNLKITGTHSGSPSPSSEKEIISIINKSKPDILFVAYGAPKQEIWISRNLSKLKTVKVAIGVGGAFDFIAGKRKRSPKIMQKLGLEWLFRLIQEPKRIKRIYNATIRFPLAILKKNLKNT